MREYATTSRTTSHSSTVPTRCAVSRPVSRAAVESLQEVTMPDDVCWCG